MKAKPKKKKAKDKPPPSSPIPPEWNKLVPDHPGISFFDALLNTEDTMALQVSNKPSMEELVKSAKGGDDKSFFDLVKMHTFIHPFESKEGSKLIMPTISADRVFYQQKWVQKKLKNGMENEQFEKYFYKAVFSRQNNTLFKATASELKRYISIRKNEWARLGMTVVDIKKELQSKKFLSGELRAKGTLEKFLERCGVKRPKARGRPKKKNTT